VTILQLISVVKLMLFEVSYELSSYLLVMKSLLWKFLVAALLHCYQDEKKLGGRRGTCAQNAPCWIR